MENVNNKINDTKDWSNRSESVALNHDLKNHDVLVLMSVKIAKGVININTFKITYRSEYVNSKFIRLIVTKLFKIPSRENILTLVVLSLVITLSSLRISWEKLILQLNMFSPSSRIANDISEFILRICSIRK